MSKVKTLANILIITVLISCAHAVRYHGRNIGGGLNLFSVEDEAQLGASVLHNVTSSMNLRDDPVVLPVLQRVGQNLNQAALDAGFRIVPWQFFYIDQPDVNAFAAPGGYIFFFRGLLYRLEHEDELAAIIGHEMGHVLARHTTSRLSNILVAYGITVFATETIRSKEEKLGDLFEIFGGIGLFFYSLNFSRHQETESDFIGFHLMADAGYDPEGMARAFERILNTEEMKQIQPGPTFLSTHPDIRRRIQTIRSRMNTLQNRPNTRVDNPDFIAMHHHLSPPQDILP